MYRCFVPWFFLYIEFKICFQMKNPRFFKIEVCECVQDTPIFKNFMYPNLIKIQVLSMWHKGTIIFIILYFARSQREPHLGCGKCQMPQFQVLLEVVFVSGLKLERVTFFGRREFKGCILATWSRTSRKTVISKSCQQSRQEQLTVFLVLKVGKHEDFEKNIKLYIIRIRIWSCPFCPMKLENSRGYTLNVFIFLDIGTDIMSKTWNHKTPGTESSKQSSFSSYQVLNKLCKPHYFYCSEKDI